MKKHWLTNTHWIEKVKKSGPVGEMNPGPLDVLISYDFIMLLIPYTCNMLSAISHKLCVLDGIHISIYLL